MPLADRLSEPRYTAADKEEITRQVYRHVWEQSVSGQLLRLPPQTGRPDAIRLLSAHDAVPTRILPLTPCKPL